MTDHSKDDQVIQVTIPLKDYKVLREMIAERQAMNGLKLWLSSRVFWLAGGLLSVLGLIEAFKRFGP